MDKTMNTAFVGDVIDESVKHAYSNELDQVDTYRALISILHSMTQDDAYTVTDVYNDIRVLAEQIRREIGQKCLESTLKTNVQSA